MALDLRREAAVIRIRIHIHIHTRIRILIRTRARSRARARVPAGVITGINTTGMRTWIWSSG